MDPFKKKMNKLQFKWHASGYYDFVSIKHQMKKKLQNDEIQKDNLDLKPHFPFRH